MYNIEREISWHVYQEEVTTWKIISASIPTPNIHIISHSQEKKTTKAMFRRKVSKNGKRMELPNEIVQSCMMIPF